MILNVRPFCWHQVLQSYKVTVLYCYIRTTLLCHLHSNLDHHYQRPASDVIWWNTYGNTTYRSVFRNLSYIQDGVFCGNGSRLNGVIFSSQHSNLGSEYASDMHMEIRTIFRDVFWTLSNIYDRAICENSYWLNAPKYVSVAIICSKSTKNNSRTAQLILLTSLHLFVNWI